MGSVKAYHLPSGHWLVCNLAFTKIRHPHFEQIGFLYKSQASQVDIRVFNVSGVARGIPAFVQIAIELARLLAFWQGTQLNQPLFQLLWS